MQTARERGRRGMSKRQRQRPRRADTDTRLEMSVNRNKYRVDRDIKTERRRNKRGETVVERVCGVYASLCIQTLL